MAQTEPASALARKIAAHSRVGAETDVLSAQAGHAFGRALRHAAVPFNGLGLSLGEISHRGAVNLAAAVEALPDGGLVAALEDGAGRRGLIGLSHGLVDALVEVQTTGRLEDHELPARPVTRIDEALCRDFLDLSFSAFTREAGGLEGRDWPERMSYGSRLDDRDRINLLLPDGKHHVLAVDLKFSTGGRGARIVLILPTDPALRAVSAGRSADANPDARWQGDRDAMLETLPVPLEAVLMRITRTLGAVEAMQEGDLLHFNLTDLDEVSLETPDGSCVLRARLGQANGYRAVRLAGASTGTEGSAATTMAAAAPPAPSIGRDSGPQVDALPHMSPLPPIEQPGAPDDPPPLPGLDDLPAIEDLPPLGALPSL